MNKNENIIAHLDVMGEEVRDLIRWSAYSKMSEEVRDRVHEDDYGGPHQSFPIRDQQDVEHAAELLHHADDPSAVKRKIMEIVKRKGLKAPATWSHEGK